MKDKYYGFIAGLISGDTNILSKQRGYSDNTAIFLLVLDCYLNDTTGSINIFEKISELYKDKAKSKYASCISYKTIKPSLYAGINAAHSNVIQETNNDDYSVIFRAIVPFLLIKFKKDTFEASDFAIMALTHTMQINYISIIFLCKLFNLIFMDKTKVELYKFINVHYSEFILSLPIPENTYSNIIEVIRGAVKIFYESDSYSAGYNLCIKPEIRAVYGMLAGAYYGFKALHRENHVKLDAGIMEIINRGYNVITKL